MASLKRLLNPTDQGSDPFEQVLSSQDGRREYVTDDDPKLPNQSFPHYYNELLGQIDGAGTINIATLDDEFYSHSLYDAQASLDEWAGQDLSSGPTQSASAISPSPMTEQNNDQICFGMIHHVAVKLSGNMSDLDHRLSKTHNGSLEGFYDMQVVKSNDKFVIVYDDEVLLGEFSEKLQLTMGNIEGLQPQYDVQAPIRSIREIIAKAKSEKEAVVRVQINVYGSRQVLQQIGRELSAHKVYLQRPSAIRMHAIYENPHVLKLPDSQTISTAPMTSVGQEIGKSEAKDLDLFKKTISNVYSSLQRGQDLDSLEGDVRLNTKLLDHQMKALDFMSQRENGPIPERFLLWRRHHIEGQPCFRHVITKHISRVDKIETGGGILADEMGMGKTLSILALILRTLQSAHEWMLSEPTLTSSNSLPLKRTKATLIVASSDLMINEWNQEMERHYDNPTLRALNVIKYHGQYRNKKAEQFDRADIIITTYHTLASDFEKGKTSLNNYKWYRLVLDEAHIIRRQSTKLHRNVAALKARSRWCLTGTPIQNRLEDIGTLFAFLKIDPWHSLATFRKHVSIPFDEGERQRAQAIEGFTYLMDSLCLRRTKDLLHLPEQLNTTRLVNFSPQEREQYERTKKMMDRAIRNQVGGFDRKSTLGHFQMQLQLRILCNHGTFQQPFSWNRRRLHLIDEREDMEATFGGEGEVTCSNCEQTMPMLANGYLYRRYTSRCRHVLCLECLEDSNASTEGSASSNCPLCAPLWGPDPSEPQSDNEAYFRNDGHSSKIQTLMSDIVANINTTKSIVFSCWTRTLDLIQSSLRGASIVFERIDGECPTSKREKILDDFAKNPGLRVLIMTTGTGAVGLNLATANRIFIVEPQWNPSVENQAIARALRLGQRNAVQVTRYVVNKTVEQEMRTLQDRKLEIAEAGMGASSKASNT